MACDEMEVLAAQMLVECADTGQAARTMSEADRREPLRAELRRAARALDMRVRSAVVGSAVVLARIDAAIWSDDTATMRRKLTPSDQ